MRKLLLLILLLATGALAQNSAWKALSEQRWNEAVPLLQEQPGEPDAARFFNLGLCYQHLNDPGRARAYYEAALKRNPWHGGLHTNLALLKSRLTETEPDETWSEAAAHCAPPQFLGLAFLVGSWAACALTWACIRERRERTLWSAVACGIVAASAGVLWGWHLWQPAEASVLPETAVLKNGPGSEFTDSIALHAGNLVEIVQRQGDWVEVDALGKVRAWMRADELLWVP